MLQQEYAQYHPIVAIAKMAHDENVEDGIKFNCHREIAKYIEPQLKSMEVRGTVKSDFGVLRVIPAEVPQLQKAASPVELVGGTSVTP